LEIPCSRVKVLVEVNQVLCHSIKLFSIRNEMEDEEVHVPAGVQFQHFGNFRRNFQRSESDAVPKIAEHVPKRNARDRRLPADDRMFTRHHLR